MNPMPKDLLTLIHRQAADLACTKFLVAAVLRQQPNRGRLLADFNDLAEDHEVRAMYSGMPEDFFEAFQESRALWAHQIAGGSTPDAD